MKVITADQVKNYFNIAVVISQFNEKITQKLYDGALQRLREIGFADDQITIVWVPGAVEIPLTVQRLARTQSFEAIVCLGAVIRGETTHYDYVCNQVSEGCQCVALAYEVPVIFGVLTTENESQALDRVGGKYGHKGKDAIDAAVHMASVLRQIG